MEELIDIHLEKLLTEARSTQREEFDSEIKHYQFLKKTLIRPSLQDFKFIEELGKGSFGEVHLVEDRNGNVFALKRQKIKTKTCVVIINEVRIQSKLHHPGIQSVIAGFSSGREYIILTEFCTFGDLRKQWKSLPQTTYTRIAWQLIDAVAYLGENLILHRDIKPTNILISMDGNLRVTDFGLAVQLVKGESYFSSNCKAGTYSYLAPEVMESTSPCKYSSLSDAYAVGITIFEIFSGRNPFNSVHEPPTHLRTYMYMDLHNNGFPHPYNKKLRQIIDSYGCPSTLQSDYEDMKLLILALTYHNPNQRPTCYEVLQNYRNADPVCWTENPDKAALVPVPNKRTTPAIRVTENPASNSFLETFTGSLKYANISSQEAQELCSLHTMYQREKHDKLKCQILDLSFETQDLFQKLKSLKKQLNEKDVQASNFQQTITNDNSLLKAQIEHGDKQMTNLNSKLQAQLNEMSNLAKRNGMLETLYSATAAELNSLRCTVTKERKRCSESLKYKCDTILEHEVQMMSKAEKIKDHERNLQLLIETEGTRVVYAPAVASPEFRHMTSRILPPNETTTTFEHQKDEIAKPIRNISLAFQGICLEGYTRGPNSQGNAINNGKEVFSCEYGDCSRKFNSCHGRNHHVMTIHLNLKPKLCDQCSRSFRTRRAVNQHKKKDHSSVVKSCAKLSKTINSTRIK